ncbi:MAG: PPP family 3-phenylpropionic acid transporter [Cognaticolwellia sp.]|jgi:PPP family 3-phenylpropionic acid transporter
MGQVVAYLSDKKQDHLSLYRYGLIGSMIFLIPCLFIPNSYWFLLLIILSLSCFMSIVSQIELLCLDAADAMIYNRVRIFGSLGFVICAILMGQILDTSSPIAIIYFGIAVLVAGYITSQKMTNYQHSKELKIPKTAFLI